MGSISVALADCKAFTLGTNYNECRAECINAECEPSSGTSSGATTNPAEDWCAMTCAKEYPCKDPESCTPPTENINKT